MITEIKIEIIKEGDFYVAYCPSLELSSYGKTECDARKAFDENFEIFLEETISKGTFEKELLRLGWQLIQHPKLKYIPPVKKLSKSVKPIISYKEKVTFPIPA